MVKLLTGMASEARRSPADGGVADVCWSLGLEQARGSPNARTRNRRNEARLLLFAFSDSDHGRDYKRDPGIGQTTGRPDNQRRGILRVRNHVAASVASQRWQHMFQAETGLAAGFLLRRTQRQAELVDALADGRFGALELGRDGASRSLILDQALHFAVILTGPTNAGSGLGALLLGGSLRTFCFSCHG